MSEMNYESVEALLRDSEVRDGVFYATFECPTSGETVTASVPVAPAAEPVGEAEEPIGFTVARSANGLIRDLLGYNATILGTTTALDSALNHAEAADAATVAAFQEDEEARKDAIFRAFTSVMHRFAWDPQEGQWVIAHESRGLGSDLQRQLKLAPLQTDHDRYMLARMAIDIATADDDLDRAETETLLGFLDADEITPDRAGAKARPSARDLGKTTEGQTRETLFMAAALVAAADKKFTVEESDRLAYYAKGLGIEEFRAEELIDYARLFFLEQFMSQRWAHRGDLGEDDRETVLEIAKRLEMDEDRAERAFERYQRTKYMSSDGFGGVSW